MTTQPLIYIPNISPFVTNATGRLSYSTLNVLDTCERLYQLEHELQSDNAREHNEHFSFGHCFGEGVAHYLTYQDKDLAMITAWLAYYPKIETEKKNQALALTALQVAFPYLDTLLQDYEVVSFEGRPAAELSFKLQIDSTYYYAGHIDVVLKHKWTGVHYIMECKHTGLQLMNLEPLYQNSGQALGYSIALDKIVGEEQSSYGVLYLVAQLGRDYKVQIKVLPFEKTLLDRLNWFITLGLDVERLHRMKELGVYPKRGGSCLTYNRPCKHFNTCQLHSLDRPAPYVVDTEVYQFTYDMDELVKDHLRRLGPVQEVIMEQETSKQDPLAIVDNLLGEI